EPDDGVDADAEEQREAGGRRRHLAQPAAPLHGGRDQPDVVDVHDERHRGERDRVHAEVVRREEPGEDEAEPEVAELGDDRAEQAPPQSAPGLAAYRLGARDRPGVRIDHRHAGSSTFSSQISRQYDVIERGQLRLYAPSQTTPSSTMHGLRMCSIRPVFSSTMWSTSRATRAVRPQNRAISASKPMPRFFRSRSRVFMISSLDLMRTRSPGSSPVRPVGVLPVALPCRKPHRLPPRNHSQRGKVRVLRACTWLNNPTPSARTDHATLALPTCTSSTYCRRLRTGSTSGAARKISVAWQECRSAPSSNGGLRLAATTRGSSRAPSRAAAPCPSSAPP